MSVVSRETLRHIEVIARFFGVDLEANRHIFRAGSLVGADAFAMVMKAMADEVERDVRCGVSVRIRAAAAARKGLK